MVLWAVESTAPPRALSVVSDGRHRTGPKGVLDDYEEAKRQLRSIRMREALHRERLITTHTQGGNSDHSLRSIAADTSDPPAAKGQLSHREEEEEEGEAEGAEEDEGEEEEDDAAFNEYKAQRLAALHHSLSAAHAAVPLPSHAYCASPSLLTSASPLLCLCLCCASVRYSERIDGCEVVRSSPSW